VGWNVPVEFEGKDELEMMRNDPMLHRDELKEQTVPT
jgi:hypothetical protein